MKEKANFDKWKYNVALMKDPNKFKQSLFDIKDDIERNTENYIETFKKVEEILEAKKEHMNTTVMASVSLAANAILEFVINIKDFFYNIVNFKPLEAKKNDAMARVDAANAELKDAQDKLKEAEDKVARLQATLKKAQEDLKIVEDRCK